MNKRNNNGRLNPLESLLVEATFEELDQSGHPEITPAKKLELMSIFRISRPDVDVASESASEFVEFELAALDEDINDFVNHGVV